MTLACRRRALALLALVAAQAGAVCPPPPSAGAVLTDDAVQLAWRTEPQAITAGRPFLLWLQLCPAEARLLRVDATMPEHGHGMNYRVELLPLGDGRWRAEGLLWHMSGRWELGFELEAAGQVRRLRQDVQLP